MRFNVNRLAINWGFEYFKKASTSLGIGYQSGEKDSWFSNRFFHASFNFKKNFSLNQQLQARSTSGSIKLITLIAYLVQYLLNSFNSMDLFFSYIPTLPKVDQNMHEGF